MFFTVTVNYIGFCFLYLSISAFRDERILLYLCFPLFLDKQEKYFWGRNIQRVATFEAPLLSGGCYFRNLTVYFNINTYQCSLEIPRKSRTIINLNVFLSLPPMSDTKLRLAGRLMIGPLIGICLYFISNKICLVVIRFIVEWNVKKKRQRYS